MSIGAYLSTREDPKRKVCAYCVGITTFISFLCFGLLPLYPYIFSSGSFSTSATITGISFIMIGYLKGVMNNTSLWKAIVQTVLLGGIAASVAYYAGVFLGSLG